MLRSTAPRVPRAFALVETCMLLLVLLAALAICLVLAPDARRRARLAGSITNLQQLGKAAGAFAADNENRIFALNWAPGTHECNGYQFPPSVSYSDAAADQAVCILRERAGRTDIQTIRGWFPHLNYNHLALADYLADSLPSPVLVSPGDGPRVAWQRAVTENPADPDTAYFSLTSRPAGQGNAEKRWPYSSSYEMQPSCFSPNTQVNTPEGPIPTVAQDPLSHRHFQVGTSRTVLGDRRFSEAQHPSHKVLLYETAQRFFGPRETFFMYPESRVPVLFIDGSVSIRSINLANRGFNPNTPSSPSATRVNYTPEISWEPPPLNDGMAQFLNGVIRWTRAGLRGRDFAGPEVDLTQ